MSYFLNKRCMPMQLQISAVILIASLSSTAMATDWRIVIASDDMVLMVDAGTFRRDEQQVTFRSAGYQPKAEARSKAGVRS